MFFGTTGTAVCGAIGATGFAAGVGIAFGACCWHAFRNYGRRSRNYRRRFRRCIRRTGTAFGTAGATGERATGAVGVAGTVFLGATGAGGFGAATGGTVFGVTGGVAAPAACPSSVAGFGFAGAAGFAGLADAGPNAPNGVPPDGFFRKKAIQPAESFRAGKLLQPYRGCLLFNLAAQNPNSRLFQRSKCPLESPPKPVKSAFPCWLSILFPRWNAELLDAANFRDVVSGRRRGPTATLLRGVLRLAEVPYSLAMRQRNRSFESGRRPSHQVNAIVVSVGNLTLGGTGKTPMVEWLARWFIERGVRTAIVSRGYKSKPGSLNDEGKELAQKLPAATHLQNPDRVAAAQQAIDQFACQLIILDDAFQHRRIRRNLDIVLLDALEPFGFDHVFPRGLLREPLEGLSSRRCRRSHSGRHGRSIPAHANPHRRPASRT